jgi:hypothetical protein
MNQRTPSASTGEFFNTIGAKRSFLGYRDGIFYRVLFFGNGLARELELLRIAQGMQSYLRRAV